MSFKITLHMTMLLKPTLFVKPVVDVVLFGDTSFFEAADARPLAAVDSTSLSGASFPEANVIIEIALHVSILLEPTLFVKPSVPLDNVGAIMLVKPTFT
ncbi:hypothetical protein FRB98_000520 [Tulasnella sp. 332]|nr:hypothetical protein FRB98_000520 [Tulasnella sp. 332]